jgi:hypothetical protein
MLRVHVNLRLKKVSRQWCRAALGSHLESLLHVWEVEYGFGFFPIAGNAAWQLCHC